MTTNERKIDWDTEEQTLVRRGAPPEIAAGIIAAMKDAHESGMLVYTDERNEHGQIVWKSNIYMGLQQN